MDQNFFGLYVPEDRLADFAANCARLSGPLGEGKAKAAALALRRQLSEVRRCHEAVERRYAAAENPQAVD